MAKFLKPKIAWLGSCFLVATLAILPKVALAADASCDAFAKKFHGAFDLFPKFCSAQDILLYAMNVGFGLAAGIVVVFIILGGYWYITSAGNEEQAEKGKKTLVNSVIGLAVIILSVVIVRVVVNTLAGSSGTSGSPTSGLPSSGNNTGAVTADFFGKFISIPSTAIVGTPLTVVALVPIANEAQLSQFCGTAANQAALSVVVNGDQNNMPIVNFTKLASVYSATAKYTGTLAGGTTAKVEAKICGQVALSQDVPVQAAQGFSSTSSTAPDAAKLQQEAASIPFALSFSNGNKTIRADVDFAGVDPMVRFDLCKTTMLKVPAEVFVNGASAGTDPNFSTGFLSVDLPQPATTPQSVSVKICGYTIGGGAKTISP